MVELRGATYILQSKIFPEKSVNKALFVLILTTAKKIILLGIKLFLFFKIGS